jgi:uncharacterized membrane protein YadS
MLAPVAALAGLAQRRTLRTENPAPGSGAAEGERPAPPVVPLFVVGFLAMVVLRSLGILPPPVLDAGRTITTVLLAAGMFGLGAGIDLRRLLRTGGRFALVGAASTLFLGGISLIGVLALT